MGLILALLLVVPLGLRLRVDNYINAELRDVAHGGLIFNPTSGKASILLIGDSEGSMYGKLLKDISRQRGYRLTVLSSAAHSALPNSNGEPNPLWDQSLAIAKSQHPDFIVLACKWTAVFQQDPASPPIAVKLLRQQTHCLVLMAQPPRPPDAASREGIRNGSQPPFFESQSDHLLRTTADARLKSLQGDGVLVEDVAPYFENEDGSLRLFGPSGRFFYHDEHHLSDIGAEQVGPDLDRIFATMGSHL